MEYFSLSIREVLRGTKKLTIQDHGHGEFSSSSPKYSNEGIKMIMMHNLTYVVGNVAA